MATTATITDLVKATATITDLVKAVANVASVDYDIFMQAGRFMESMQKSKESGQGKKTG